MALFNRQMIHWKLNEGDLLGYTLSPFIEYQVDVVFKVLSVSQDTWLADLEVVASPYVPVGTIYINQPTWGFKKIKSSPLNGSLTYNFVS
jgi:hypothetical protein